MPNYATVNASPVAKQNAGHFTRRARCLSGGSCRQWKDLPLSWRRFALVGVG